jgi:hypothetical protein
MSADQFMQKACLLADQNQTGQSNKIGNQYRILKSSIIDFLMSQ